MSKRDYWRLADGILVGVAIALLPGALIGKVKHNDFGFMFTVDLTVYLLSIVKLGVWCTKAEINE